MQKKGNKFGTHRVISPKGVLPQPADKIDNNMDEIYDNEILIDVMTLNIDSASFTQINEQAGGDEEKRLGPVGKNFFFSQGIFHWKTSYVCFSSI